MVGIQTTFRDQNQRVPMEDITVLSQRWTQLILETLRWSFACDFRVLVTSHWPNVCYGFARLCESLYLLMVRWKDCFARGCESFFELGMAALFVTIWSFLLGLTSMWCLLYLFIIMGAAICAIRYLGYTSGLLIVVIFTIFILRVFANYWILGPLFIVGGFLFSLNRTRLVVLVAMLYSLYYVKQEVGWSGVLVSINLAFISCDAFICTFKWCDDVSETTHFEEPDSSFVEDDIPAESNFCVPAKEAELAGSCKPSSKPAAKSTFCYKQKKVSVISIPVIKSSGNASNEIKRIIHCSDHYEALGFSRYKKIDATLLKKEYKKKAMLVHPDKNMGSPLASESFKKVQCAYEVLSDSLKKRDYDEQLRNEEKKCLSHKFASTDSYRGESRHIQCMKCGNLHIWICTNRTNWKARWCQDCSQYHQARDGDGWVEYKGSLGSVLHQKVEIPRAFVCAQSKIFDVSEWAICQGMACRPNTHHPSFHVNMVGSEKPQRCSSSTYPWDSDEKMTDEEEEFDLWLQQAVASGLFCDISKHRKSWTRFKLSPKKVKKHWTRMSRWSH